MTLVTLNIGLYLLSALSLTGALFKKDQKWWLPLSYIMILAGFILQGKILTDQLASQSFANVSATVALSFTSLIMVLIELPYIKRHLNTAIVISLFAAFTQFLQIFNYNEVSFSTPSLWLSIHVLTSLIAYSILLLASIQALLVYLRDRALRTKKSITHRFPPLMRMELLLFRLLLIGFIVLTLSLLTSFAFFDQWFSPHFIHKTVLTGLAWLLYGSILFAHQYFGLRGRPAAKFILMTAVVLLLGITGTRLIQEYMFATHL